MCLSISLALFIFPLSRFKIPSTRIPYICLHYWTNSSPPLPTSLLPPPPPAPGRTFDSYRGGGDVDQSECCRSLHLGPMRSSSRIGKTLANSLGGLVWEREESKRYVKLYQCRGGRRRDKNTLHNITVCALNTCVLCLVCAWSPDEHSFEYTASRKQL